MKKTVFICLMTVSFFSANAQEQKKKEIKDKPKRSFSEKFYFGGNLSPSLNGNVIIGSIMAGYKVTDDLSLGLSGNSQYIFSTNFLNFGGSIFSRYTIISEIFAQTEYEYLNFQYYPINSLDKKRRGYNSLLVGGGYSQSLSGSVSANAVILYNLLYNPNDVYQPYNSPIVIRGGISFGL